MKKKGAGVKPGESGKTAVFISEFRPNTGAGSGVESSLTKIRTPIFLRGLILVAILAQNIGLLFRSLLVWGIFFQKSPSINRLSSLFAIYSGFFFFLISFSSSSSLSV